MIVWFEQLSVLLKLIPNQFKTKDKVSLGLQENKQHPAFSTDLTISMKNPGSIKAVSIFWRMQTLLQLFFQNLASRIKFYLQPFSKKPVFQQITHH